MKKMIKVSELFEVKYGVNLELNSLEQCKDGINFVSRTAKNNGVSAKVKLIEGTEPIPAGTISVAGGGSVMESFLQLQPYYSGRDLFYLKPKIKLSNEVLLYYCACLRYNKFKFSFGRQANSTLEDLMIPSIDEIPSWVKDTSIIKLGKSLLSGLSYEEGKLIKADENPNKVRLDKLFIVKNGIASSKVKRFKKKESEEDLPYIRPSYKQITSIDAYVKKSTIDEKYIFPKHTLYVSTDGQGSHTFSYVSVCEFVPNSNVSVLEPRRDMSLEEKLYYSNYITNSRYKFSYGRKPKGERLKSLMIPEYPNKFINDTSVEKLMNIMLSELNNLL
ncbi:restriction endonuclease subunit S [Romboutsia sp. 1001216sp1]|uniref:restriction endonuclease subunit S n=1 Tax=Romboutsia sp. 1001216sp1 TaxID=2986997 RepID=UPI00232CB839|nr:restriction endonuclease subunit S [Romboutsia sp. 1001216sp1]MDB8789186.1 restriction endonuclease subunit S [Romboutsia sp. 1001216sp1]